MDTLYSRLELNGTWQMAYSPDAYRSAELPTCRWSDIKDAVPGYWEDMTDKFRMAPFFCELRVNPEYGVQRYPIAGVVPDMALPNLTGCFFYRRSFTCEELDGSPVLAFSGVQNSVSVWLNGIFIGRHEGYSSPFELSIPDGLLESGENTIVLAVSNIRLEGYNCEPVSGVTSRAACECTGGVGNIELRLYHSAIRDIYVTTAENLASVTVHVDALSQAIDYSWRLLDGKRELRRGEAHGSEFTIDASTLEKWSPASPKLYTIELVAQGEGSVGEGEYTLSRRFGVRRLLPDGVHMKLNGRPICLRGICEHGYFPLTAHPSNDISYYRKIIKTLKSLGFNFIRFHTHIPMPEYLEAADEMGMVMHVESPNNTTLAEWHDIVRYCRRHTSALIYCTGNELLMDDPFIEHQALCANAVHEGTDALFSPMSAMRGVEYHWNEPGIDSETVDKPFRHHPRRLKRLAEFCDLYSSYANGKLSYNSLDADPAQQDEWSDVYNKPRLSHEICIHGTYADLSLKDRYIGTRIGETELFTSVERHLKEVGLYDRAPIYYRNSSEWQRRLRKHCFEACRRCEKLAGYDYLGDIDHHWHTFGYHVGMMNEFYELKPGETVRNVRMYNSDTVLLCTIKDGSFPANMCTSVNFTSGQSVPFELAVSNYAGDIPSGVLRIRLLGNDRTLYRKTIRVGDIAAGYTGALHELKLSMPRVTSPMALKLCVTLSGGDIDAENEWELYVFPKPTRLERPPHDMVITEHMNAKQLLDTLRSGKDVVLFASNEADLPFASQATSFRISLAGRTHGYLATVIADHPAIRELPHEGFCGWQFRRMLEGGRAVMLDGDIPFAPIIEVANTHKFARRLASVFEYCVMGRRLLVCTLKLNDSDPGAMWLKNSLIAYAQSEEFLPTDTISELQLNRLFSKPEIEAQENTNIAYNPNDKTMKRRGV